MLPLRFSYYLTAKSKRQIQRIIEKPTIRNFRLVFQNPFGQNFNIGLKKVRVSQISTLIFSQILAKSRKKNQKIKMFWLEGGLNYKLLGQSQVSYPLDYRVLLIKTKHFICIYITLDQNLNQKYCLNFEIRGLFSTEY